MSQVEVMDIEARVKTVLAKHEIVHELVPCDPELADTARFCEHYGVPVEQSANAIIVASKKEPKQYAACLVLAHTRLDVNRAVRDLMGVKRLSFATADETTALTGMLVGGVTPFGLPSELPIYVDARVMQPEWVIVGGGSRSLKVRLSPSELEKLPNVRVVPDLAKEPS